MSDLISRSQLLKKFNDTGIQITFDLPVEEILGDDVDIDDFTMLVQDAIQAYKNMVIGTIEGQPTAYNPDKVVEEFKALKDYKELYDVYKLIGTIEEFRNLKYKKNVLPIASIEFSKEDMQKIVDEKVAQIELDIQEIRNQAIDEFAERLKEKYGCFGYIDEITFEKVDEIAEQMKAGGEDE